MRVLLSWLNDFAPVGTDAAPVIAALDELGLAVDSLQKVGEGLDDIVVARVLATRQHPDADRIQLVDVDPGGGEPIQVACGAFNFGAGDLVPLAPVGSRLPGGMEIGRRKLRGEWSNGMLCSAAELEMGDDGGGIMVLSTDAAPGTPLVEALSLARDVVFELDVTANRPDAMSVAGVARDVAAKLKLPFTLEYPEVSEAAYRVENLASVLVESPDLCPRFTARVLEGVPYVESPAWMQRRLTLAGMRPITLAVDVSNYVMLELGQPTHPYDLDRLPDEGLLVRAAKPGEMVTTLDGVERRVGDVPSGTTGDCLICDTRGNPVGIAGIMGGAGSGISETTTRVLLETAYFLPMAIARTSKRLRLRSEASARFERGVDIEGLERAAARYCSLVGSEVAAGIIDERATPPEARRTRVRVSRVNHVLGSELDAPAIAGYLDPIGFTATLPAGQPNPAAELEVVLPSWRPDATSEIDVIEEVARHHGYARLGARPLTGSRTGGLTAYQRRRRQIREILCGLGVDEAQTSQLVAPEDHGLVDWTDPTISGANPMVREESVLRATLMPGLLRSLAYNASHRTVEIALFELGKVFRVPSDSGSDLPEETERMAAAVAGRDATTAVGIWRTLAEHLRVAAPNLVGSDSPGLHSSRAARALVGTTEIGFVGEVHPDVLDRWGLPGPVAWLDLDVEALLAAPTRPIEQQPVSRFPSSDIDLAFEVNEAVPAGEVEVTIATEAGGLLVELALFDVYRGAGVAEGARGLAFHLRLQAGDRTLTDKDVAEIRGRVIAAVTKAHGASLRGPAAE
ncbi:MAG TPA: phenylalanine--tRNA ligase subunit beta [Acidimicrobiales bacterium]|nr:phenylalanine--tRNA ligase subunit beta [Acidimicrobiales bacterium]